MREILFRGKTHDGRLVYGTGWTEFLNMFPDRTGNLWLWSDHQWKEIIHETLGQYTGLKDKNGKMIFEGDICSVFLESRENVEALVEFKDGRFILKYPIIDIDSGGLSLALIRYTINHSVEVIGNIHDNPGLLK